MTAKERIEDWFSDTLNEAEEAIKAGELTPDDVVDAFAAALADWHSYYQKSADNYEKLINAVITHYRAK